MTSFFQNIQDKFKQFKNSEFFTRRNIIIGITLIILAISLYPGIKLIEDQRILRSRADEGDLCETDPENDENWEKAYDGECTACNLRSNTYRNVCTQELKDFTDEDGSCTDSCIIPTSPTPSINPTASPHPGTCVVDSKQNPNVGNTCAACIVTNNPTLLGSIRSGISHAQCSNTQKSSKTDTQLINYWCNGGISTGASSDCLTKKALCGTSCGYPALSPSPRSPSPIPSPSSALIANNATCGTFTAPGNVQAGRAFNVTLNVTNTGSKTWNSQENYRLGRWDSPTNNGWILPEINQERVFLPQAQFIASLNQFNTGNTATFNFQVTAPTTLGIKTLDLRMVQDGVEWFGGICSKSINVTASSVRPSAASSPSAPTSAGACDFNADGKYDDKDFKIWVDEFTGQRRTLRADCNEDLKVDLADFNLWRDAKINNE